MSSLNFLLKNTFFKSWFFIFLKKYIKKPFFLLLKPVLLIFVFYSPHFKNRHEFLYEKTLCTSKAQKTRKSHFFKLPF